MARTSRPARSRAKPLPRAARSRPVPRTGLTRDNRITNRLVRQGKLPKSQLEVFPQRAKVKAIKGAKRSSPRLKTIVAPRARIGKRRGRIGIGR